MSEPVRFKTIIPHFVVLDVVKTTEYYRDVLGFAILGYFLDPPLFALVKCDDAELHFGKADGTRSRPTIRSERVWDAMLTSSSRIS